MAKNDSTIWALCCLVFNLFYVERTSSKLSNLLLYIFLLSFFPIIPSTYICGHSFLPPPQPSRPSPSWPTPALYDSQPHNFLSDYDNLSLDYLLLYFLQFILFIHFKYCLKFFFHYCIYCD